MITYKAGYKFVDGGVHAQLIDFPAVITCAADLPQARQHLAAALVDMAECQIALGQALPAPNPLATDAEMDVEEPLYLHIRVSSAVRTEPIGAVA